MNGLRFVTIFIICVVTLSVNCFAQGKVSRPAQQPTHTSIPKKSSPKMSVSEPDGYINGHGYVDLGLPSGTMWATCNIGALSPYDFGNYYAWEESMPKSNYDWSNCFDCLDNIGDIEGKFNIYTIDGKIKITPSSSHDTAKENWGGTWRMSIIEEIEELIENCKWETSRKDGPKGCKGTGPNGKSIFLPAAGFRNGTGFNDDNRLGHYWSNTLSQSNSMSASYLYFRIDGIKNGIAEWLGQRRFGKSVRPVTE